MENSTRQIQTTPPKPRRLVDNAAEVRRRKEAAERLIKERHEALRRQHEEKIHKINEERMRLQRELKERHAKELKRQQDVLQRRMALMERDKARKQEILEKNHAVASRLSANSSRKNYAFGSSTPRELSFLDPRILKMNAMEKRYSPDNKSSPPNGPVNARRGRSMASMLSTSMFVSTPERTPDRTHQTASITRLAQPKTTPSKTHNSMTQSVYHAWQHPPATPTARPRKKQFNQITNSGPHFVHTGSVASAPNRKIDSKPKTPSPRGTPTKAVNNKPSTPAPVEPTTSLQRKESLARSDGVATPLGVTASEPPRSENSFTSDEIPLEMAEREVHYQTSVDSPVVELNENAYEVKESHHIPSEVEQTTIINEVDVVIEPAAPVHTQAEHASEGESASAEIIAKDVIVTAPMPTSATEEKLISPVPKSSEIDTVPVAKIASPPTPASHMEGGASLADELAGVFGGPSPMADPLAAHEVPENSAHLTPLVNTAATQQLVEQHTEISQHKKMAENPVVGKAAEISSMGKQTEVANAESPAQVSYENPLIDFHSGGEEAKSAVAATVEHVHNVTNHIRTNGIEHQPHPEISADLPGTVPSKESEGSTLRKVPTPPNEFIISTQAHRLRREQEQKEIDERKARIAAILAKSRDLSSATPTVGGRISPPKGGTAQDVLKRLASNGNLPALQKLVARHTPEPPTIDQIAPEDPAPQAI